MAKYLSYNGLQRVVNHVKTLLDGKADTSVTDSLVSRISAVENYGNHLYYGTYLSQWSIETLEQNKDNGTYVFEECPAVKVDDLYIEASNGAMFVCVTAGSGENAHWKYACNLALGEGIDVDGIISSTSENPLQNKVIYELLQGKVDVVSGKGLSTNDYTTAEKNKLSGIAEGAEINMQSDWNVTDTSSDAYIKNKPTIPTNTNQLTNGAGFVTSSGVTSVATGTGLTGGTITGTGTIKVNLKSGDTQLSSTSNATATTITSGRLYPVQTDSSGYLAVHVPWTDNNTDTHYSAYLYTTNSSTGTSNVNSVTNGNLRLNLVENGSVRSSRLIKGVGGATVTTDTSGNIIVTGEVGTTTDTTFIPLAT